MHRLAGDDHDVLTFVRLILELNMSLLWGPLLTMQATCLAICGRRGGPQGERAPCR
jgi:hypothetical protein